MITFVEYKDKIEQLKSRTKQILSKTGNEDLFQVRSDNEFHIVLAGQYNAGKSSIVKMITGRDDIKIGAAPTTITIDRYPWNGMWIVDTPGIGTQTHPDHDSLSYDEFDRADVIVYVITQELFDKRIIEDHFKVLAFDHGKASEMMLIVNKMCKQSGGNTPENQKIKKESLEKTSIGSLLSLDDLKITFIDAKRYLKSIEILKTDPTRATIYREESGYDNFMRNITEFIQNKQFSSKQTTVLFELNGCLRKCIERQNVNSKYKELDDLVENLNRQRNTIENFMKKIEAEAERIYNDSSRKINKVGRELCSFVVPGLDKSSFNEKFLSAENQAKDISEKCYKDLVELLDQYKGIDIKLDELDTSDWSKNIQINLVKKYKGYSEDIRYTLQGIGNGMQFFGKEVFSISSPKDSVFSLSLKDFSGTKTHDYVIKAAHTLGLKLGPWQASKITKYIAYGSKAMDILGNALDVAADVKSEFDEVHYSKMLRELREDIRFQFSSAADDVKNFGRNFIEDCIHKPLQASLLNYDQKTARLTEQKSEISNTSKEMLEIQNECLSLIRDIQNNSNN